MTLPDGVDVKVTSDRKLSKIVVDTSDGDIFHSYANTSATTDRSRYVADVVPTFANGASVYQVFEVRVSPERQGELARWTKVQRARAARAPATCQLWRADIQALYDAVAIDMGQGRHDSDFFGYPNSVGKRLANNVRLWPNLRKSDKVARPDGSKSAELIPDSLRHEASTVESRRSWCR